MHYKDYQHSRDVAWQILIDCHITSLPIRMTDICRQLGIRLRSMPPGDERDGVSFYADGIPYIALNTMRTASRRRFTAAHELGHILLGHAGKPALLGTDEQAADSFAARLLAPACVLRGCQVRTADDIQQLCGISRQAAAIRTERMCLLYQRGAFLTSPLEQQVYRQFLPYIRRHRFPAAP